MYTKSKSMGSKKQDLSNYVEGYDIYNSKLLELLKDPKIETVEYTITKYEYRPDLIAQDFYRDEKYTGILMITCGIGLEEYIRGVILKLIPKSVLDRIIEYEV